MLDNWLYPEEKQTLHIFMAEGRFAMWSKTTTKVRLLFPAEFGREGCHSLVSTFKEMAPRSSKKIFLGYKVEKRPIRFSKGFIYISERRKYLQLQVFQSKFSKKKERGEVSALIFNRKN